MTIFYRLSNIDDPEERLEDAALWKALRDEYGHEIELLPNDADMEGRLGFGRRKHHEWFAQPMTADVQYWTDPAFLSRARRSFALCDLDEAEAEVKRLHAMGKGAFFKSVFMKHLTMPLPVGTDMRDELDAMVYSFCDRGRCIMIQELCEIEYEHRFFVIGREIVTHSPIQWALTPIDRLEPGTVARTPKSHPTQNLPIFGALFDCAYEARQALRTEHCSLDVAMIDGAPGIVELNAMHLGQLGLYAADVRALAKASRALIPTPQRSAGHRDREGAMPISRERMARYPGGSIKSKEWLTFRASIIKRADSRCEGTPQHPECRAANGEAHPETGGRVVLTIAHMDHDESHADPERCRALCQRCHNKWDAPHRKINAARTRRGKMAQMDLVDAIGSRP